MTLRPLFESLASHSVRRMLDGPEWRALELGSAPSEAYDRFVESLVRAHAAAAHALAFLWALAPESCRGALESDLAGEMGRDSSDAVAHVERLRDVARAADLAGRLPDLEREARDRFRARAAGPYPYATLAEGGLALLAEAAAHERLLAQSASRIAAALGTHRGLDVGALSWFAHLSETGPALADARAGSLDDFAGGYRIEAERARALLGAAIPEGLLVATYFP